MDDLVRQAMAKWPHVPDCFGWLGLDARGQWHMRDDPVQAIGAFQSGRPGAKGAVLRHEKLIDFIQRNYEADAMGRWYFQNGPQRVFVELEATPYIWRLNAQFEVTAHTGPVAQVLACWVDEHGHVYLHTHMGFGLVHSLDVVWAAEALEQGVWPLQEGLKHTWPQQFGFVMSPENTQNPTRKSDPP